MRKILIVPVGSIDSDILRNVSASLIETFHCSVDIGEEIPVPHGSYHAVRRQYHSTRILKELQAIRGRDIERVLGVADVDLYVPELNFVFGEADLSSGVTVISVARLRQEFYGQAQNRELLMERCVKEAIHELGHTYGLGHCPEPGCIMFFSNSLKDTDFKGPGFCSVCKMQVKID
jgi:archaemetzincin